MIKTILEKAGLKVILWALAILLIAAGSAGFWAGAKLRPDDSSLIPVSALGSLQDSLKTARAALKSSGDMIATLRQENSSRKRQINVQAATIVDVKAKLAAVSGGGEAKPEADGWSTYPAPGKIDHFLTARFRQKPDSLEYTLKDRPLYLEIWEGKTDNDWYIYAWDILAKKPAVIDTFTIQRDKNWTPPKPWYKKVGTMLKYAGVAAAAGGAGYLIGKSF